MMTDDEIHERLQRLASQLGCLRQFFWFSSRWTTHHSEQHGGASTADCRIMFSTSLKAGPSIDGSGATFEDACTDIERQAYERVAATRTS